MTQKIDNTILQRYQIIKKIGNGTYGTVWKAKDRINNNNIVALKKVQDGYRDDIDSQRIYRQIMYSKQFCHRNLTKLYFYHTFENSRDIYMIMQFVQYDLSRIIRLGKIQTDAQRYFIMYQMINAVQYLHNVDLVHRDLKPANILLTKQWIVKLCDFGLIKSVNKKDQNDQHPMSQNIATRWYRAPQILLGSDSYGKSVDIWSMGCIFAEIITGKILFPGQSPMNQLQKIIQITGKPKKQTLKKMTSIDAQTILKNEQFLKQKKSLKKVLNIQDQNLINLLQKMLEFDPSKRITIEQIKSHPFITKLMKNTAPKSSHFSKIKRPIKIQFENKILNAKKYQNLLNIYADPVFQETNQKSRASLNIQINPELNKNTSSNNIKIKLSGMYASSIYPSEEKRNLNGIEQVYKINNKAQNIQKRDNLNVNYNYNYNMNMNDILKTKKLKSTNSNSSLHLTKEIFYAPTTNKKKSSQQTNFSDFYFDQIFKIGDKMKISLDNNNQIDVKSNKNINLLSYQPQIQSFQYQSKSQYQYQCKQQNTKINFKIKDQIMNSTLNNQQTKNLSKREKLQRQTQINNLKKSSTFLADNNKKLKY